MTPESSSTHKQAHLGLRGSMVGLNILLIMTGIILMTLGVKINQNLTSVPGDSDDLPRLWALGLLPILIGILGIICVLSGNRKWIGVWVGFSSVLGVAAFVFFAVTGYLDSATYGVTVHIFGECVQEDTTCKCAWADGSRWWVLEDSSCNTVKFVTILYVVLIVIFVLCLTAAVICATLGCVLTCCLKFCIPKSCDHYESTVYTMSPTSVSTTYRAHGGPSIGTAYEHLRGQYESVS